MNKKLLFLVCGLLGLPSSVMAAMLSADSGSSPAEARPIAPPYIPEQMDIPAGTSPAAGSGAPNASGQSNASTPSSSADNKNPPASAIKKIPYSDAPDEDDESELFEAVKSDTQFRRDAAFQALVDSKLPMTPKQIRKLHKMMDLTLQANASDPGTPPTSVTSTMQVRLDPGAPMPVIRLAAGFVTSMVFQDVTGAAWPIEAYSIGDPGTFNIQWDKSSNVMFMQPNKRHAHGNLAIKLVGQNTPLMISLVSAQKEVDYRADIQIASRGPNATTPIASSGMGDGKFNNTMVQILDGIPPAGSQKLLMDESYGQAWSKGDTFYFRSKLQVLSPAWKSKVSSPDGMQVYELMQTPLILVSSEGRTMSIQLKGF